MSPLNTIALCLGWALIAGALAVIWRHRRHQRRRQMRAQQDARDRAHVWQGRPAPRHPMAHAGTPPRPWVIVPEDIGGTFRATTQAEAPDTPDANATFAELVVPLDELSAPSVTTTEEIKQ